MRNPFKVGDEIHGFARGAFGRDSYACRKVEAVGPDWLVTRNTGDEPEMISGWTLIIASQCSDDRTYCYEGDCFE